LTQKILLVNELNTREQFELTQMEARLLLNSGAGIFCLGDTIHLESELGEPVIVIHAGLGEESTRYEMFLAAISEVRAEDAGGTAEDRNPFTGKILQIVAPPKGGPEQN
jgi:hypothetical protein